MAEKSLTIGRIEFAPAPEGIPFKFNAIDINAIFAKDRAGVDAARAIFSGPITLDWLHKSFDSAVEAGLHEFEAMMRPVVSKAR